MTEKKDDSAEAAELRRRAEDQARANAGSIPENTNADSIGEAERLLYELRVHQIELEMQNDELRRSQAELDAARARYFDLYDMAPVGYVTISEKGIVLEANLTAAGLLGAPKSSLIRQAFSRFILPEDQDIYYHHRRCLFETGEPQKCELRIVGKNGAIFWARIDAVVPRSEVAEVFCNTTLTDITELKKTELELQASLAGNEALLRDGIEKNAELLSGKALLKERERQLMLLAQKVNSAQEEERSNICRNLHDELGFRLSAMGMEISWLERQEEVKPEYIKKLGEALEAINTELQMIYKGLRPVALDRLGVEAAIQALIWEYKDRVDFKINAKIESAACEARGEKAIVIYRILQEALTNIIKHSRAREVSIGLRRGGESLIMEIADDGIGFVLEETSKERGLGLLGMKERAAAVGGELAIESEPGRGTRICLEIAAQ